MIKPRATRRGSVSAFPVQVAAMFPIVYFQPMKQTAAIFTFADHPSSLFRHGTVSEPLPGCRFVKSEHIGMTRVIAPSTFVDCLMSQVLLAFTPQNRSERPTTVSASHFEQRIAW